MSDDGISQEEATAPYRQAIEVLLSLWDNPDLQEDARYLGTDLREAVEALRQLL